MNYPCIHIEAEIHKMKKKDTVIKGQLFALTELTKAKKYHQAGDFINAQTYYERVLKLNPYNYDAMHHLALVKHSNNELIEAEQLINSALAQSPHSPTIFFNAGIITASLNKNNEALEYFDKAIKLKSRYTEAYYNKAVILSNMNHHTEAIECLKRSLKISPNYTESSLLIIKCLINQHQYDEAEVFFNRALKFFKNKSFLFNYRGQLLFSLTEFNEALINFNQAIELNNTDPGIFNNLGLTLKQLYRYTEAIEYFNQALKLNPRFYQARTNLAATYDELSNFDLALEHFSLAIQHDPVSNIAYLGRSNLFIKIKKFDLALHDSEKILERNPKDIYALNNKGICLFQMNNLEQALIYFRKALDIDPKYIHALSNEGETLIFLNRLNEAEKSFYQLLLLCPTHIKALDGMAVAALRSCNWVNFDKIKELLIDQINQQTKSINPFTCLGYIDNPEIQYVCTQNYAKYLTEHKPKQLSRKSIQKNDKIRIGYVSSDFKEHATSHLIAELFEKHNRDIFKIYAFSFGIDDKSPLRNRVVNSFDVFFDIFDKSDFEIASLIHQNEIDILIDLKGYTGQSRARIFAYRPAPIQVNYLGYPGTMGVDFIDYIISDSIIIPTEMKRFYSEKIITLPNTYQINDRQRIISNKNYTRNEAGLPTNGFVYCSFNNNWKITPKVFDIWMRLLNESNESVLWLLNDNELAKYNLKIEATKRGISADRIIFADRVPPPEHLARHALADLFLDTLPCNAHTTASDALWAGLPVITCLGSSFASRVAGSLVSAAGIPELATNDLCEYELLAKELARNNSLLDSFKTRLASQRNYCALFDSTAQTRAIEKAYIAMYEKYTSLLPPEDIFI